MRSHKSASPQEKAEIKYLLTWLAGSVEDKLCFLRRGRLPPMDELSFIEPDVDSVSFIERCMAPRLRILLSLTLRSS